MGDGKGGPLTHPQIFSKKTLLQLSLYTIEITYKDSHTKFFPLKSSVGKADAGGYHHGVETVGNGCNAISAAST